MNRILPLSATILAITASVLLFITDKPALAQQAPAVESWETVSIPADWKRPRSAADENGFRWYRCQIQIPDTWKGKDLIVHVDTVDEAREIYINGVLSATIGAMPPKFRSGLGEERSHTIKSDRVLAGQTNVLAIRVYRKYPRGGFNVAAPVITDGKQAISTRGDWQHRVGDQRGWALWKDADKQGFLFSKLADAATIIAEFRKLENDRGAQSVAQSLSLFETTAGISVDAVLADPDIAQPLSMKFDERGRLWVMEYRQYPNPAGIKIVSRDKYLRSVYDKLPLPPPLGARGQDRISIHEDSNGDGVFDLHKVFVDGLNIATSFAMGDGGVYVLNPPYLLFYPDHDKNDKPDGDPQVILEGFGIEDTHSAASNLRWGPDGWLYGAQGSTVSGNIRHYGTKEKPVSTMGQGIWRYHPQLKKYEMFAEGGGNTYGLEFDSAGRAYSGYNGGNTRGFHYIQGGYYLKGFSKHGQLSNPYAFGYFPAMAHSQVPRFTHAFVIYEDPVLPQQYQNRLFGIEPLQGRVVYSSLQADTSTFKTADLGHPLKTSDTWFRPVDIQVGPDGAVYVADLYEQVISHADHYQGRVDNTNGRIYRLRPSENWQASRFDCSQYSNQELFDLFESPIRFRRQIAIRLLRNRTLTKSDIQVLRNLVESGQGFTALNALWALHITGNYNLTIAHQALNNENVHVRAWSIRLAADHLELDDAYRQRLVNQARLELSVQVRSQLAATARRVSPELFVGIIKELLKRDEDLDDLHVPLMLWWAIEANATDFDSIKDIFGETDIWSQTMTQKVILERLVKRYAMSGTREELEMLAWLFQQAPNTSSTSKLMAGFEQSFQGRSLATMPQPLLDQIRTAGGGSLKLKVRLGDSEAIAQAVSRVADSKTNVKERIELISVLGQIGAPSAISPLLEIITSDADSLVKQATLSSLQGFESEDIPVQTIAAYTTLSAETQVTAQSLLVSRSEWTLQLLSQIADNHIPRESIRRETILKMLLHNNKTIKQQVLNHLVPFPEPHLKNYSSRYCS